MLTSNYYVVDPGHAEGKEMVSPFVDASSLEMALSEFGLEERKFWLWVAGLFSTMRICHIRMRRKGKYEDKRSTISKHPES